MSHPKLTKKQEAFAQHYALHRNAAEAYRSAYDTQAAPAVVAVAAQKLLNNPKIALRIEELSAKVDEIAQAKFEITAERILEEVASMAFYNAQDYFAWGTYERPKLKRNKETGGWDRVTTDDGMQVMQKVPFCQPKGSDELSREQLKAVLAANETITKTGDVVLEVKMGDKLGALKLLMAHKGMLKTVHEGKGGGPVVVMMTSAEANL